MAAEPTAAHDTPSSWWGRRSLRARLTAAAAVVIAVGMIAAGGLLVWRLHSSLMANLDNSIAQQSSTIADQAAHSELPRRLPDPDDGAPTVQVVAADGRVLAGSGDLGYRKRMFTLTGSDDTVVRTQQPAGHPGTDYRVAATTADTRSGPVTVYAALPTEPVDSSTTELLSALAVGLPILVAILTLIGWLLVGRALRPVDAVRRQAADIPGTDLSRRLRPPAAEDELARLTATFNELLARIETASAQQHRFVADAAHELRSPIATLRTQLEVTGRSADHQGDLAAALPGLLGDIDRLSRLVDDLLALARLDAHPAPHRQVVDLDDIVLDQARAVRHRGPSVDVTGVSAGQVLGDPSALTSVVRNLLDNATRHAAAVVRVALTTRTGAVILEVADDGPGIAPADRDRIFERFTRLDEARSRDAGGAGLGLAIVHEAVGAHDGTVTVSDNHPGARFTVTMPAAD
ncbi:sensor histidine kinase [Flexivirga sp.]|uniref:sensor histidine kinase n=1 Tax=Flexivirga sp. TaxID=1962927 RepID=UPI003F816341